ncbi:MAG: type II secretion system F family protein [Planctomycetes bacterium]|nr:type II secretion system F family protein [Planctomycetota bacterium]
MGMEVLYPLFPVLLGLCAGIAFFSANTLVRERVEEVGIDRKAETITGSKFFQYLLPFVQVASHYIAKIPSEFANEALGFADESLKRLSTKRRFLRMMGRMREGLKKRLIQAGKIDVFSADDMLGTCVVSSVLWTLIGFYFCFMLDIELVEAVIFLSFLLGIYFPVLSLNGFVRKRQKSILRALPYSIDLLSLSMEAGLDFTTALGRIVERQRGTPIGTELGEMLRRVKMGQTRKDALKDLAERTKLDDVVSFANSLIQADELGTPIGAVLRVQAEQMRTKRFQRAEEQAGKAPVKILFPLVLFIIPTVFMVLFGPMLLKAMGLA